jgi:membrane protein DedA with SNARE-associated domain
VDEGSDKSAVEAWLKRNLPLMMLGFAVLFFVVPRISPWDGLNENLAFGQRFSRWLLERLEQLFDDYGYYVVFIGVLLENSMFLGLLVPGAIILILAGLAAENGSINVYYVIALAVLATVIGDTISYFIGRLGWTKLLDRMGMTESMERVRDRMEKHTFWLILSYHMAGYSRMVGPAAAGIFRIPYRKWAPLDYAGGTIWVLAFTTLGVVLGLAGVEFTDTKRIAQLLEYAILAMLIITVITVYRRSMGDDGSPRAAAVRVDEE